MENKKNIGRPPKFESAEKLELKIKDYFDNITITKSAWDYVENGEKDEKGNPLFNKVPKLNNAGNQIKYTEYVEIPTINGICSFLEINKDTWTEYSNKELFSVPIKKAKERIEKYLEEQLYRKDQVTGIIFNLKNNYGWKDKQDIEHSGKIEMPSITITK